MPVDESAFIKKRAATLEDVSRRAGLSPATVSRVLNNHPGVRPETRQRVDDAVAALDYVPHFAAQALAGRSLDTLAVIFPVMASGFFADVLDGIDEAAAAEGFQINTLLTRHRTGEQRALAQTLSRAQASAILLMNVMIDPSVVDMACRQDVPLIVIDTPVRGAGGGGEQDGKDIPAVVIDNFGAAKAATQHLADAGCKHVAILAGPRDSYDATQRLRGCRHAAKQRGLTLDVWAGDFKESLAIDQTRRQLSAGNRPDAIFALNDDMAIGARQALREADLKVPEDVMLVGFDDVSAARHLGLTTVRLPMRELGREACRMAVAAARGEPVSTSPRVMPCELIVRHSTTGDPE